MTCEVKRWRARRHDLSGHGPRSDGPLAEEHGAQRPSRLAERQTSMTDADQAQAIAERYVAVWNERDDACRRRLIAELWAPDGEHFVGAKEVRGHEALEHRVVGSHVRNVVEGGHHFRAAPGARALKDVVTFHWEMRPEGRDEVVAGGLEFLLLDEGGRIRADYMFPL